MVHIGTLMALEEAGLRPDYVAGTSSGAIIGGLYASGFTPGELEGLLAEVDWRELFTDSPERADLFLAQKDERASYTLQFRFDGLRPILPTSYLTGQRVNALLSDLAFKGNFRAAGDFDNLRVGFRAVCTDLLSGERVVLGGGSLSEALMASSAVPVLIAAVPREGQLLVDGGLVDAIPTDVVAEMGADIIVASDVSAALRPTSKLGNPLEILDQVMSITMRGPNAMSLARADFVVAPDLPDHLSTDFEGIDSLVAVGYRAARAAIAQWEGRPEASHLVRLAGIHEGHGPAVRVVAFEVEGGDEEQQRRARELVGQELMGRSVDREGLRATANRLLEDGSLSDVTIQAVAVETDGGASRESERRITLKARLASRPLLREIRIEGAALYDPPELRRALSSVTGAPVDRVAVAADVVALEAYYRDRGYPMPLVRTVAFDPVSGVLSFFLDEGAIASIQIDGLDRTRDFVILRELPFQVGDLFGEHSVRQIVEDIYSTGLFERVTLEPARAPGGGLQLVVRVQERPRHLGRVGIHYLEEQKTEGFVEYQNSNFLGLGGKFPVQGLTGSRRSQFSFETRLDRLFKSFLTYQIEAGFLREEINTFDQSNRIGTYEEEGVRFSAAVGQQVRRFGQLRLGIKAENIDATTIEGSGIPDVSHRIRGFELRSIVDTLDRTTFPSRGVRHEFAYETASDALDGNVSYVKLHLSVESFLTIGRHTFNPRLLFATADNTLPFVRWFRLGGMDSFYGFERDQIRGRQILLVSGEYRFLIPWGPVAPLHFSIRYDWGGAWDDAQSFALADMTSGGGIKLSLESPIGPLEIAYGMREGGHTRFYLGLGYRF
jgi:NTE family protein